MTPCQFDSGGQHNARWRLQLHYSHVGQMASYGTRVDACDNHLAEAAAVITGTKGNVAGIVVLTEVGAS